MKRLLSVLSIFVAAAYVGVAAAGASVAPSSVFCIAGQTETFNLSDESQFSAASDYQSAANEGGFYYDTSEGTEETSEIPFGFDGDEYLPSEGPFDFTTAFVTVSAGACNQQAPPPKANVFLCYSIFDQVPAVFPVDVAQNLLTQGGYWAPSAVLGNVDGGTNIGGYHLICNLASTQSATDSTLGGAGEVDGPAAQADVTDVAGYYAIIGS